MMFQNEDGFRHEEIPAVGILLTNLGTPDAPTATALRRYLREFLSDPRVIELPRWKWWLILNLFVLTTRPRASAKLYQEVWTEEGSPLLVTTRKQAAAAEGLLAKTLGSPFRVAVGMRYGDPSIAQGLDELRRQGCRRILVLPLYPQYSAATTGSTFDALSDALKRWRWVPELRTIHQYHDAPAYVRALAASIRELWERDGKPEVLLFSFHGIPQRYFDGGDPYPCQCRKTARLVAEELGLAADRYLVSFQSLFGREEWIKPYTDVTVRALARSGIRRLDVICPGFSADCLETLEEIDGQNRHFFLDAGGETFRYIPCLNDRDDHVAALAGLIEQNLAGWSVAKAAWDGAAAAERGTASRSRAEALEALNLGADGSVLLAQGKV
jgi:ferrochelatase